MLLVEGGFDVRTLRLERIEFEEFVRMSEMRGWHYTREGPNPSCVYCTIENPHFTGLPSEPAPQDYFHFLLSLVGDQGDEARLNFHADQVTVFTRQDANGNTHPTNSFYTRCARKSETLDHFSWMLGDTRDRMSAIDVKYMQCTGREDRTRLSFSRIEDQFVTSSLKVPTNHLNQFGLPQRDRTYAMAVWSPDN